MSEQKQRKIGLIGIEKRFSIDELKRLGRETLNISPLSNLCGFEFDLTGGEKFNLDKKTLTRLREELGVNYVAFVGYGTSIFSDEHKMILSQPNSHTLAHEIGHSFNLSHPFSECDSIYAMLKCNKNNCSRYGSIMCSAENRGNFTQEEIQQMEVQL